MYKRYKKKEFCIKIGIVMNYRNCKYIYFWIVRVVGREEKKRKKKRRKKGYLLLR